jgi:hypothetical protein
MDQKLNRAWSCTVLLPPKLLRVLQEQQFERLGSGRTHQVDEFGSSPSERGRHILLVA